MANWSSLSLFIGASLILVFFPGPNTIYIVARSIEQGPGAGMISSLGVQVATLVYVVAAASGLSALLTSSLLLFNLLKYAGGVYLVFLGLRTLLNKKESARSDVSIQLAPGRLFSQGVLVNLLNPKTGLFIFAFLPQFVDLSGNSIPAQIVVLGSVLVLLGMLSDTTYALVAGRLGKGLRQFRYLIVRKYIAGALYIGLGVFAVLTGLG